MSPEFIMMHYKQMHQHDKVHLSEGNQGFKMIILPLITTMRSLRMHKGDWCGHNLRHCINLLMHQGIGFGKNFINGGDVHP